jgi:DUF971 family protein
MRLPDDTAPTSYLLDEENRQLFISWTDGHESVHPYESLRRGCPCAWCAGEGGQKGMVEETTRFTEQQTTVYSVELVGRYGLTPTWGDGHHTGIYTFERLRASCACDACRGERAASRR